VSNPTEANPARAHAPLLSRLGVIGIDAIEPVVLAALITAEPLTTRSIPWPPLSCGRASRRDGRP
jgi:hypothetical protein